MGRSNFQEKLPQGIFIQIVVKALDQYGWQLLKPVWEKPLSFTETIQFCKEIGAVLWTPQTISDFEHEKILELMRSSGLNSLDGRLFWTGMNRYNATHFTYGSDDELEYFLPSEYFNWVTISFMPSVIAHVPLLNLHICPELWEIYRNDQGLQNAQAEVSLSKSSNGIMRSISSE